MTFKQLAEEILKLPLERQEDTATVSCDIMQEAFPVTNLGTVQRNDILGDVLDTGHAVICVDA